MFFFIYMLFLTTILAIFHTVMTEIKTQKRKNIIIKAKEKLIAATLMAVTQNDAEDGAKNKKKALQ